MPRRGLTLIELMVTLVLIGIVLSVIPAWAPRTRPRDDGWQAAVRRARHGAIASGQPVHGYSDTLGLYTALPGGSVISERAGEGAGSAGRRNAHAP